MEQRNYRVGSSEDIIKKMKEIYGIENTKTIAETTLNSNPNSKNITAFLKIDEGRKGAIVNQKYREVTFPETWSSILYLIGEEPEKFKSRLEKDLSINLS